MAEPKRHMDVPQGACFGYYFPPDAIAKSNYIYVIV